MLITVANVRDSTAAPARPTDRLTETTGQHVDLMTEPVEAVPRKELDPEMRRGGAEKADVPMLSGASVAVERRGARPRAAGPACVEEAEGGVGVVNSRIQTFIAAIEI